MDGNAGDDFIAAVAGDEVHVVPGLDEGAAFLFRKTRVSNGEWTVVT